LASSTAGRAGSHHPRDPLPQRHTSTFSPHAADAVALHGVARVANSGRKYMAHQAVQHHQQAVHSLARGRQAGHELKAQVVRHVRAAGKVVKDASKATVHWVKEHKEAIIEVAAVVATVAATVALGPVGAPPRRRR